MNLGKDEKKKSGSQEAGKSVDGLKEAKIKKIKIKIAIISMTITLAALALIMGGFFAWKKYTNTLQEMTKLQEQLQGSGIPLGEEPTGSEAPVEPERDESAELSNESANEDEYVGWNTYTNAEIGYTLRYPVDWSVKEVDLYSETIGNDVKYIVINSPGKKYFLHWGLKAKEDSFAITDRTGMGAGNISKDGTVKILGKIYDINRFVYKGKTKEVFYPGAGVSETADRKYDFIATLGADNSTNYDSVDIDNVAEKRLAEKILRSVKIIPKSSASSGCVPTLSNSDKQVISDWKTYSNSKYDFSFKYPKEWSVTDKENKRVVIADATNHEYFSWNSEEMTAFDYMGYSKTGSRNVKVACQNAEETFLSGDPSDPDLKDSRMIIVDFKKSGKRHLLTYNYQYIGASLSSDLVERFEILLKTVKFSN